MTFVINPYSNYSIEGNLLQETVWENNRRVINSIGQVQITTKISQEEVDGMIALKPQLGDIIAYTMRDKKAQKLYGLRVGYYDFMFFTFTLFYKR